MSKDKMLSKEELLKWLENIVNHSCVLGITHPHLATHPTNNDNQAYAQLRQMVENQPEVNFSSWFYKNCKRQRKAGAKICQVCPFRKIIESQEAGVRIVGEKKSER